MKGKPELKIEVEKIYKTKKNSNGIFVARIIQIPGSTSSFRTHFA